MDFDVQADKIDSIDDYSTRALDASDFDNQGKAVRLTSYSEHTSGFFVKGRNVEFVYTLNEPMFIESIYVETSGYHEKSSLKFKWTRVDGSPKVVTSDFENDFFSADVNDVVTKISFRPSSERRKDLKITYVEIQGMTLSALGDAIKSLDNLEEIKQETKEYCQEAFGKRDSALEEIDELKSEKASVQGDLSDLHDEIDSVDGAISTLREEKIEVEGKIGAHSKDLILVQAEVAKEKDSKKIYQKELSNLEAEITDSEAKLKALRSDVNLFPTEIKGFVEQGANSISRYLLLAFLPIVAIFWSTGHLFYSALEFASLYSAKVDVSVWEVFVSRLPYVTVMLAIISACYKISETFIREIISINNQRLSLTKISIIAKDVSQASSAGLGFDDNQIYERRTKLKMDLLRDHLKGYISKGYSYGETQAIDKPSSSSSRKSDVNEDSKELEVSDQGEVDSYEQEDSALED